MNAKSILFSFFCRYPSLFSRVQLSKSNPDVSQLAFLSLVGRGQTVFDVGANFGGYTRLFSKLVGQRAGGVYAFEPVAASMKRLQQAVQGLNNVVLVRKGLGLAPQKATIFIPNGDLGQSSLAKHHVGSWSGDASCAEETIEVTTLDLFIEENGVKRLDFLKVDVEGYEGAVLEGALATFARCKPTIFMELHPQLLTEHTHAQILDLVHRHFSEVKAYHQERGTLAMRILESYGVGGPVTEIRDLRSIIEGYRSGRLLEPCWIVGRN